MEDEEEDVTYYTPMDADEREDEGVHNRAGDGRNTVENERDCNWGTTTIDEAYGDSRRELLVGEDGERDSDEEDSTYTAYITFCCHPSCLLQRATADKFCSAIILQKHTAGLYDYI